MNDLWKESSHWVSAALTAWFIIRQQEVNKDTFEHCLRCVFRFIQKKIQRQTFLLESTRVRCCWRCVHKDVHRQLFPALLFQQHHWWGIFLLRRGKMAILTLLLLRCFYGQTTSCKNFYKVGAMSSRTVGVISTRKVSSYVYIHRNSDTAEHTWYLPGLF